MNSSLSQLQKIQGVQGAYIVDKTGQIIESTTNKDVSHDVTGSLAAAIFGAVGQSLEKLDLGALTHCMFEGKGGSVHIVGAGEQLVLVVTHKQANAGLVRLGLQHATASLNA
jgi:predicted regulator of Ras-like GTPase activity (Roadblock/LC7/MglB family)